MSDESYEPKEWWVSVHGTKRGPYPDEGSARVVAEHVKRTTPNVSVAIEDPLGLSEPID